MTDATVADDYDWLVSAAGAEAFARAAAGPADPLRLQQQLRKSLPAERARLVVEQLELRQRARRKFSAAEQMFFTRQTLEQATDERLAAYKAARFAAVAPTGVWADICCGIGGSISCCFFHIFICFKTFLATNLSD